MSANSSRRYPPELRERAVRMVAEMSSGHTLEARRPGGGAPTRGPLPSSGAGSGGGLVDKGVWEAACSVRPYLDEMLDSAAAADVDAGLARLLERGTRGEDVEGPLRALLAEHEATKEVRPRA